MHFAIPPAAQRHIPPNESSPPQPGLQHERQPVGWRNLINIAIVVFLLQHEPGFFQVLPDRCTREEIQMPGDVLAEKMARGETLEIRHQENKQSIRFQYL